MCTELHISCWKSEPINVLSTAHTKITTFPYISVRIDPKRLERMLTLTQNQTNTNLRHSHWPTYMDTGSFTNMASYVLMLTVTPQRPYLYIICKFQSSSSKTLFKMVITSLLTFGNVLITIIKAEKTAPKVAKNLPL